MEIPSQLYSLSPLSNDHVNPHPAPVPGPLASHKPRNKLGSNGVAVLEAYWSRNANSSQLPPLSDRKELTRTIKDLPGCGFWNDIKTLDWFKRRMKKLQSANRPPLPSKDALRHLDVLLKSQPNPSSDVIRTWATLLARDGGPGAVEFWTGYIAHVIRDGQASNGSSEVGRLLSATLPTPAGTVTPELHSLSLRSSNSDNSSSPTKMKYDPANSPTIVSLTIPPHPTESSPSSPSTETESPISPFFGQTQPQNSLRSIVQRAVQTLSNQDPIENVGRLPNDADEFVAMFAPYENKLIRLQKMLDSK